MKYLIVFSLLGFTACAALFEREQAEPFEPAVENSDLVFIRTGDRNYYYVIDKKRGVCFFHGRLYGRKHMAEMDCQKLPEYQRFAGKPAPQPAEPKSDKTPRRDTGAETEAPPNPGSKVQRPPVTLSNEDREAFRRVHVQHFCSRKRGAEEELTTLLSRHQLTRDQYDDAKAEFSADRDLWEALTAEAMAACP